MTDCSSAILSFALEDRWIITGESERHFLSCIIAPAGKPARAAYHGDAVAGASAARTRWGAEYIWEAHRAIAEYKRFNAVYDLHRRDAPPPPA